MFQDSLARIRDSFSADNTHQLTGDLWNIDRWFDFAHFKQSASYCAEKFQQAGLSQVESIAFPADGRTCYGDWVVPKAWDATEAELTIIEPEEIPLARYTQQPCSLAMWSAPTPAGGIEAEVVLLEDPDTSDSNLDRTELAGKILLSSRPAFELKRLAARCGAVGVLSDHHAVYGAVTRERPPDKVSWVNVWSDDPNGWPFVERDAPAFGFSMSARQGQLLRDLLRHRQPVKVRARVDSHLYDGSFDWVTGLIPGRQPDSEVLVFAHLYEQGAQDNAAGCAIVLEAARCLNQLIRSGRLPQPRRSIRFALSWEIYGLLAYASTRPEATRRIVAGLNLDSLGAPPAVCQAQLELHANPHAQASYTDVLLQRIMEHCLPAGEWVMAAFDTTDAVIADPTIGIPTPWLGEMVSSLWHSSLDTPDKIDGRRLAAEGVVAATYLYAIANADSQDLRWLAGEVYLEAVKSLRNAGQAVAESLTNVVPNDAWWAAQRRLHYVRDRGLQALRSCAELSSSPEVAARLADLKDRLDVEMQQQLLTLESLLASRVAGWSSPPPLSLEPAEQEAAKWVPRRRLMGGLTLSQLPPEAWPEAARVTRGQNPRWSQALCCALYWVDGRRTMLEVKQLTEQELGRLDVDLFAYFRFLSQHGYLELVPAHALRSGKG